MDNLYVRAAVLDGVPGDPDHAKGTHINFNANDGVLIAAETGYGDLDMGRAAIGGWWYSEESDHLTRTDSDGDPLQRNSKGLYALAEKTLYKPDGSDGRHLDGFARIAFANDSVNQVNYSGSFGLSYVGPFASRPDDLAGIAFHGVHNGDDFLDAARTSGEPSLAAEWGIEATYSFQATSWMRFQPDVQYISNPGTAPGVDDAFIIGLRFEITM